MFCNTSKIFDNNLKEYYQKLKNKVKDIYYLIGVQIYVK
jgi:hypothetical protein